MKTQITAQAALSLLPLPNNRRDAEVGRRGTLIVEMYAPKGTDPQQPHNQDELYIVYSGNGTFVCGDERMTFGVGDVLFVPAGVTHRFEQFSDDFATWVVFYGEAGGELPLPAAIAEGENPPPDSALTRNALIWRTRSAYGVLSEFLDSLSESQATNPKDAAGWAVKDHVLHLVPWLRSMIWVMNKRPKVDGMGISKEQYAQGFDVVNDIIFQREKHRSFYDARWQLHRCYSEFMSLLMSLPNEAVLQPFKSYQTDSDKTDPVIFWLWGNSGGHFYEHLPWMKAIINQ